MRRPVRIKKCRRRNELAQTFAEARLARGNPARDSDGRHALDMNTARRASAMAFKRHFVTHGRRTNISELTPRWRSRSICARLADAPSRESNANHHDGRTSEWKRSPSPSAAG